MTELSIKRPVGWANAAVYGILMIGIYYSAFTWLIRHDWEREDYSYAYLIPFIVLYLVWDKRDKLAEFRSRVSWKGLIPFVIGLFLFWLGELGGEYFSLYMSSWLILVGICWIHLGWTKLKALAFPLFITLAMFPLPSFLYNRVTLELKLISSKIGVDMMQWFGMSAFREGNIIDLGFTQLQVVDACSGLRFVIPLLILSLLMAYFYRAALWKRIVLVLSSVPLSIVTNSLRIALTGFFYEIWGQKVAEGFFHGFSGWIIFITSVVVLLLEIGILRLLPPKKVRSENNRKFNQEQDQSETEKKVSSDKNPWLPMKSAQFIVITILLGITLIISQTFDFREKIPMAESFADFPLKIGQWAGNRQVLEQKFIDELDFTDYVMIDFRKTDGKQINFYVAYYESQRKGESIHSPASCLPGSGWSFEQAGISQLNVPGFYSGSIPVSRAFMKKGDSQQLVYYWFPQRDRVLTNLYQLKIFTFWNALTKQRTDGALVRLITPVYSKENIDQAEERIKVFGAEIVPVLMKFLPGSRG
ncbi:MAG: VPLPA-CTERM-specific exosortase XrtD [Candidatus Adiutricales bacterium]